MNKTNPTHYKTYSVEVWEMERKIWGDEAWKLHLEMAAFEYRMRAGNKEGVEAMEDISKARYIESKLKEIKKEEWKNQ